MPYYQIIGQTELHMESSINLTASPVFDSKCPQGGAKSKVIEMVKIHSLGDIDVITTFNANTPLKL